MKFCETISECDTRGRNGDVIAAIPGVRGSTTLNSYLINTARQAAGRAKFNVRSDAPYYNIPFQIIITMVKYTCKEKFTQADTPISLL